jgi:hypothetical protein
MQCASRVPLSRGLLNEHIQLFVRILSSSPKGFFSLCDCLSLAPPRRARRTPPSRPRPVGPPPPPLRQSGSQAHRTSHCTRDFVASRHTRVRSVRRESTSLAPRHTGGRGRAGRARCAARACRGASRAVGVRVGLDSLDCPCRAVLFASRRVARRAFPGARHLPPLRPAPRLASQACVAPLASPFHYIRYDAAPAPATAR